MADIRDRSVFFEGISRAEYQSLSGIGAANQNYSGYSFTASFVPLRAFDPNSASDAERGRVLATLIMDLLTPSN